MEECGKVKFGKRKCIAYCKPIAKYDLKYNNWKKAEKADYGKSFSVVQYNTRFGKKQQNNEFEYYVIMNGMRPENYSKTGSSTGWGMNKFLEVIDEIDANIKVACILMDIDGPLEREAKLMAEYINKIKENPKCTKVNILGISKCGTMLVSMLKYLSDTNLEKLNAAAYMAPYLGTIFASPVKLYKKIDDTIEIVHGKLVKKMLPYLENIKPYTKNIKEAGNGLVDNLKQVHWNVFSRSHMDYDISEIEGQGVPKEHMDRYDSGFLINLFDNKTLERLNTINFTNITTRCSEKILSDAILERNINKGMLYLSSKVIFDDEISDGMVSLKSAQYIEQICNKKGIKIETKEVKNGHHDIASDKRIISDVIEIIREKEKNIEQLEEVER